MSLTIELPSATQAQLEKEASQNGMAVERYARELIEKSMGLIGEKTPERLQAEFEEWERDFNELLELGNEVTAPEIPDEALRRENMYEDRGI